MTVFYLAHSSEYLRKCSELLSFMLVAHLLLMAIPLHSATTFIAADAELTDLYPVTHQNQGIISGPQDNLGHCEDCTVLAVSSPNVPAKIALSLIDIGGNWMLGPDDGLRLGITPYITPHRPASLYILLQVFLI